MAEKDKRYYWLKLKRDFFKRHDIQIIEGMPNGKDYILFYLKLLCESVDHDGNLRFSEEIPYNEQMLATITNTNIDIVRSAVKLFAELHMIDIMDDGTYYMTQVQKMIGSETYWAQKKREQRKKELPPANVGQFPTLSNGSPICPSKSIDKEIEKDIDIELEREEKNAPDINVGHNAPPPSLTKSKSKKEQPVKHKRGEYQHVLLTDEQEDKLIEEYGLEFTLKAITFLDEYIEMKGYKAKNHYLAIRKWVIDAVKEKEEKAIKKGEVPKERYGNFDVHEAFKLALERSYGDNDDDEDDEPEQSEELKQRMEAVKARCGQ